MSVRQVSMRAALLWPAAAAAQAATVALLRLMLLCIGNLLTES